MAATPRRSKRSLEISARLLEATPEDLQGEPGYRFWFVSTNGEYVAAIEQEEGLIWLPQSTEPIRLFEHFCEDRHSALPMTAMILGPMLGA